MTIIRSVIVGMSSAFALALSTVSTDRLYSDPEVEPTVIEYLKQRDAEQDARIARLEEIVTNGMVVNGGDATVIVADDSVSHRLLVAEYRRQIEESYDRLHPTSGRD